MVLLTPLGESIRQFAGLLISPYILAASRPQSSSVHFRYHQPWACMLVRSQLLSVFLRIVNPSISPSVLPYNSFMLLASLCVLRDVSLQVYINLQLYTRTIALTYEHTQP